MGENCGQYLANGRPVMVEGRLRFNSWETDGQKRSKLEVVADNVQFLSRGTAPQQEQDSEPAEIPGEGEDTIPF